MPLLLVPLEGFTLPLSTRPKPAVLVAASLLHLESLRVLGTTTARDGAGRAHTAAEALG
jgi:hypothetical protein